MRECSKPLCHERSSAASRRRGQPTCLSPSRSGKPRNVAGTWAYLVLFLRIMAVVSLVKGVYHWGQICGIGVAPTAAFEAHTVAWQSATVFFAVIDLVAAVGLWLAAAWGAVVWLTAVVSMAVVEVFFPQVYGGSIFIVLVEVTLLGLYCGSRSWPRASGRSEATCANANDLGLYPGVQRSGEDQSGDRDRVMGRRNHCRRFPKHRRHTRHRRGAWRARRPGAIRGLRRFA